MGDLPDGTTVAAATVAGPSASPEAGESAIGWFRALATVVAVLVVGFVLLAWLPNYLLTHLTGMSRSGRVTVVTIEFFLVFFAVAWGLRRLQAKRLI
jgi:hypothetical protein